MDIWKQQKTAIEYAKRQGLNVENRSFMYNYVPSVEVRKGCFVALCDSLNFRGNATIGYLSREITEDEMEEIIYLAKAYIRDGIHGMFEVVFNAKDNNTNEILSDREITALWDGEIFSYKDTLEFRKKYLAEEGITWHEISPAMVKRLNSILFKDN